MRDIKFNIPRDMAEQSKRVGDALDAVQFSPEYLPAIERLNRAMAGSFAVFGGSITDLMPYASHMPLEAYCVRDGHKVIRVDGNMYQCATCAREFAYVGKMETGELWREFWRRLNQKRKRLGLAWMFDEFLAELERLQGWR